MDRKPSREMPPGEIPDPQRMTVWKVSFWWISVPLTTVIYLVFVMPLIFMAYLFEGNAIGEFLTSSRLAPAIFFGGGFSLIMLAAAALSSKVTFTGATFTSLGYFLILEGAVLKEDPPIFLGLFYILLPAVFSFLKKLGIVDYK